MAELKFLKVGAQEREPACSCSVQGELPTQTDKERPAWITGTIKTGAGIIPVISTDLAMCDYWEHVKCRTSAFRNGYAVKPGLYAAGSPGRDSDVLVSANYKLSFDTLRKALRGLNAWVLVLDTKGINVWCAAGKGVFGTGELLRLISLTSLERVVDHRKIIVPQLGAPGISSHQVKKASGFKVYYGPVRAGDIGAYIAAGYKATGDMRTVNFPVVDRLVLTPMEISPAMKKYYPLYALVVLLIAGLQPSGIFFRDALIGGLPFLLLGLVSVLAGALVTPVLLPFIPFRSFALKGWLAGLVCVLLFVRFIPMAGQLNPVLLLFTFLFFPLASSYIALQFTGSTTFTGMSGVKKELKISVPVYMAGVAVSIVILLGYKFFQWRII
jgi:hypothetical protein